jgi:hypothetical protein
MEFKEREILVEDMRSIAAMAIIKKLGRDMVMEAIAIIAFMVEKCIPLIVDQGIRDLVVMAQVVVEEDMKMEVEEDMGMEVMEEVEAMEE